ncbi:MAG: hypothetical protein IM566_04245 [Pseudanabaena sp. M152S2SP2A07QC]|jgi:hypothetical protein|nr:hypothetical protein [Pseudanabaena sp. M109S1SP2A07QC]MCA6546634.1 hypothetical protein [Pseudanabaena sp. M152S2SP2A07QC]
MSIFYEIDKGAAKFYCYKTKDFYLKEIILFAIHGTKDLCITRQEIIDENHILIEQKQTIIEPSIQSIKAFRMAVNKYYCRRILSNILGLARVKI